VSKSPTSKDTWRVTRPALLKVITNWVTMQPLNVIGSTVPSARIDVFWIVSDDGLLAQVKFCCWVEPETSVETPLPTQACHQ
jgi:hypothetical protein